MNAVVSTITQLLPAEIITTDPEQITLYSQDVFTVGPPICAVVRPRDIEEVQALVRACLERGTPIVTRGGGMSYTSGYLATAPDSVLVDMAQMDAVVEVNLEDRYVTVEAGCSRSSTNISRRWAFEHPTGAPCQGDTQPSAAGYHKTAFSGAAVRAARRQIMCSR